MPRSSKASTDDTSETLTEGSDTIDADAGTQAEAQADTAAEFDTAHPDPNVGVTQQFNVAPTDEELAKAAATRVASDPSKPSAPEAPDTSALDDEAAKAAADKPVETEAAEAKPEDGIHPESGLDARLHMAWDLAKRGLAFASVNDLAKAVMLMLDMQKTPAPHESPVAVAAAKGETPSLL